MLFRRDLIYRICQKLKVDNIAYLFNLTKDFIFLKRKDQIVLFHCILFESCHFLTVYFVKCKHSGNCTSFLYTLNPVNLYINSKWPLLITLHNCSLSLKQQGKTGSFAYIFCQSLWFFNRLKNHIHALTYQAFRSNKPCIPQV